AESRDGDAVATLTRNVADELKIDAAVGKDRLRVAEVQDCIVSNLHAFTRAIGVCCRALKLNTGAENLRRKDTSVSISALNKAVSLATKLYRCQIGGIITTDNLVLLAALKPGANPQGAVDPEITESGARG